MAFGHLIPLATFNNRFILDVSPVFHCISLRLNLRLFVCFFFPGRILISVIGSQAIRHRDGILLDYTGGRM